MKIIHVIAGLEPHAGGPSYSVPELCKRLVSNNYDITLASIRGNQSRSDIYIREFERWHTFGKLAVSPDLKAWLKGQVRSGNDTIVHNHGLWRMPNIYAGQSAGWSANCKVICSPRGMLSVPALRISTTSKRVFGLLFQDRLLQTFHAFHVTSEAEHADVRRLGLRQPVICLPNGIDLPTLAHRKCPTGSRRKLLYLGRVHPIKGLPVLVEAWAGICDRFPDWDLIIAGPDVSGHTNKLKQLCGKLNAQRVEFLDAVYGDEKAKLLRSADLFVLPSLSENFGISVAEALAAGLPVIVSTGAPWNGIIDNRCGWWVPPSVAAFSSTLIEAMQSPSGALFAMGRRGRSWMERDYAWEAIAVQMLAAYHWLIEGGTTPECVITS